MRARIVRFAVIVSMVAITVFGLPLAVGAARYYVVDEQSDLEGDAEVTADAIAPALAAGAIPTAVSPVSAESPAAPIIGIQVDNELYNNGPHLATLRTIAEEVGMHASLWTATGWGGAELPYGRVLPVYAGYSDGFWEESTTGWPAFGVMHFTYNTVRDDLTVGADLREAPVEIDDDANLGAGDPGPRSAIPNSYAAYLRDPTGNQLVAWGVRSPK